MLTIYWSPGLWPAWSSDPPCRSPVANPERRRADPWPSPPACSPDAAQPHRDLVAPSPSGGTAAGAVGRRPAPGCWRLPSSSSCRCADSVTRLEGERSGRWKWWGAKRRWHWRNNGVRGLHPVFAVKIPFKLSATAVISCVFTFGSWFGSFSDNTQAPVQEAKLLSALHEEICLLCRSKQGSLHYNRWDQGLLLIVKYCHQNYF